MSPYPRPKQLHLRVRNDLNSLREKLRHRLVMLLCLAGQSLFLMPPLVFAQVSLPAPPGDITNKATGSFVDAADNSTQIVESNVVSVTVVEIAGITVTAGGTSGSNLTGGIVYFDFIITNTGNDPTQFFIPEAPAAIVGGTFNLATRPIQVVAYNPAGTSTAVTGVTVPANGQQTGPTTATGTDGLLGKNGIVPAGGSVTIRVPIAITAAIGQPVSVTMGDTGSTNPLGQNQVYSNNNNLDIYTQDNPDGTTNGAIVETTGTPVNGDTLTHRQEASASKSITVTPGSVSISGTIFEDVNYSGGAGRNSTTTGVVVRPNVRVEIYDASGNYLGNTFTDATGKYTFNAANTTAALTANNTFQIRVVNSFITSSRSGGCTPAVDVNTPPAACLQIPVQTFRTSGDVNADHIWDADPNRVGGEQPTKIDAPANSGTQTLSSLNAVAGQAVASLTTVNVGNYSISGVDFGYNFDTIVNTNDSGQGSLRQFITNSNALQGESSLPGGYETSIFMIPNGVANPGQNTSYTNQLTSGVAVINLLSDLPAITDTKTRLDGSTQTAKIGNTNSGQIGTGGTVGIDKVTLPLFDRPEIEVKGAYTLTATGSYAEIKNIAFNANRIFVAGDNSLVQDNLVGMRADGTGDATTAGVVNHGLEVGAGSNIVVRHNYVRVNESGIRRNATGSNLTIEYNEVDIPSSGQTNTFDGLLLIGSGTNDILRYNLSKNMRGAGVELGFTGGTLTNTSIENNTFLHNGYFGSSPSTETMGVVAYSLTPTSTISLSKNIITGSSGPGVVVISAAGLKLTQNSIYGNGVSGNGAGLSIDLDSTIRDPNAYNTAQGVTPNGTAIANLPNNGMNYPIFTKAQRAGNTLKLAGYIGTSAAGNTAFAGATIEIYKSDNSDNNQNGEVIAGDGTSKSHGEGRYYLGTITADSNGLFNTTLPIPPSLTDGINNTTLGTTDLITAIATNATGSTSEFSEDIPITVAGNPNILLVKRITAINGLQFTGYEDTSSRYDDNVISTPTAQEPQPDTDQWPDPPSSFLVGKIDGGTIKPSDSIEYTIYFISAGTEDAKHVLFCDRVPANVTFNPKAFNYLTPDAASLPGADRGIAINLGGNLRSYTNASGDDLAQYFPPNQEPTYNDYAQFFPGATQSFLSQKICSDGLNTNGAVVVNLGTLPKAASTANPADSYGFIRFQGVVK